MYRAAIQSNPGYAMAHCWYADLLGGAGRCEEALEEMRMAEELDPVSPVLNTIFGWMLYFARDYEKAISRYQKALELDPQFVFAIFWLAKVYEQQSRFEEALTEFERAVRMVEGHPKTRAGLAHALAVSGRHEEARRILDDLTALSRAQYVPALDIAVIHMGLGDTDQAFAWLERAYQDHCGFLVWMNSDPVMDPLRRDPRYHDLLHRIGYPGHS